MTESNADRARCIVEEDLDFDPPHFRQLVRRLKNNHRTYLVCYAGGRVQTTLTFHEFALRALRLAVRWQLEEGIQPGDRVVVSLPNSAEFLIATTAAFLSGAAVVPMDSGASEETKKQIAQHVSASLVVAEANQTHATDDFSFDELLDRLPVVPPDSLALLVPTSGTTSESKTVQLDMSALLSNAESMKRLHFGGDHCCHMCVLPLFHVNAFNLSFLGTLYSESKLVLNRSFYLPEFWRIIEREKVDFVSVVPSVLTTLVDHASRFSGSIEFRPRYFLTAAAPMSPHLRDSFVSAYDTAIYQGYGLSEAVNFSLTVPPDCGDDTYRKVMNSKDRVSVGCAVFGNQVECLDETGRVLEERETGEICIRGHNVMRGYMGNEEANALAFAFGWLHTGDIGHYEWVDGRKYFFITGRMKEIVKCHGRLVSIAEVERQVAPLLPACAMAVVGFPNDLSGEELGLYVERKDGSGGEAEILRRIVEKMGERDAPKVVVFGSKLPVTSTGKVIRRKLVHHFEPFEKENLSVRLRKVVNARQ